MLPAVVCAVCAIAAPAAAQTGGTMTVSVSNDRAAARGVSLTAKLRYEQQCGYPGSKPAALTLPAAAPSRLSVLVDGKPARGVAVSGRVVTIEMPKPPEVMCDSITVGTLTLKLRGLTNPQSSGTYRVTAR